MSELGCAEARVEASARLDGEVDAGTLRALERHLGACPACRAHHADIARVRRTLRTQPTGSVPDLSETILERVAGMRRQRSAEWTARLRVGAIAATVAALVVVGASLPGSVQPPSAANASELSERIRAAARDLNALRANFEITERGWHPDVPVRRFTARLAFRAPESFVLSIRDHTLYPNPRRWPANNVDVIANRRRWWIREPTTCPTAALPGCAIGATTEQRTILARQPFEGAGALPTDVAIPLETLASASGFEVLGRERVLGRPCYRVALPYRQAVPLVGALQPGGSWRPFRPFDRVEISVDSETWFPLRYEVVRSRAPLLSVRATSFEQPSRLDADLFAPPRGGFVRRGGFRPRPFEAVERTVPSLRVDLAPYRAGRTGDGGRMLAFANGVTWLKVATHAPQPPSLLYGTKAEEVALQGGGYAYYEPSTLSLRRRVDLYGDRVDVHLESNLARAELLEVAASLGIRGRRLPRVRAQGGLRIRRLDPDQAPPLAFVRTPTYLPPGAEAAAAFLSRGRGRRATVTVYYRRPQAEYDGIGVRITQARPVRLLPPTSERTRAVRIGGVEGRWIAGRGEVEWIDGHTYRAVAAPSFGLSTAVRVARSLGESP